MTACSMPSPISPPPPPTSLASGVLVPFYVRSSRIGFVLVLRLQQQAVDAVVVPGTTAVVALSLCLSVAYVELLSIPDS